MRNDAVRDVLRAANIPIIPTRQASETRYYEASGFRDKAHGKDAITAPLGACPVLHVLRRHIHARHAVSRCVLCADGSTAPLLCVRACI